MLPHAREDHLVIQELQEDVSSTVRSQGWYLFYTGAVHIRSGSREYVEASVRTSAVVKIDVREDTVVVSCTCPGFRTVDVCPHIWATTLTAERKGYLGRIGEIQDPVVEPNRDPEIEFEDGKYIVQIGTETISA